MAADRYGATGTAPAPTEATPDEMVRCWRCNRLLALSLTRPWHIACPRCKADNRGKVE